MSVKNKRLAKRFINKKTVAIFLAILFISFLYFSVPMAVFSDSLTYYNYMKIFKGIAPISSWDLVRGPTLPFMIYLSVTLFCNAMLGVLALSYLFFMGLQALFYFVLNKINKLLKTNREIKIASMILFVVLIFINPLIFGYCHALLTEFVAIFFTLFSCILSWMWLKIDFFKNKLKYIIYNILLAIMFIFIWFLKQPYFTIALFPLFIACVLSVIRNFNLKNIMQRFGTLIICIMCLLLGINGWRTFLSSNGVDTERPASVDSYFLSGGIIKGISNARLVSNDDIKIDEVKNDKYLSSSDKSKVEQIINDQKNGGHETVQILNILSAYDRRIIDKIPIYQPTGALTTEIAFDVWVKVATRHPIVLIDSYASNYMSSVDVYAYYTNPKTGTLSPIRGFSIHGHENHSIGLLYTFFPANMDIWTRDQKIYPGLKYVVNDYKSVTKQFFRLFGLAYCVLYTLMYLIIPLAFIYAIVIYIRLLKKKSSSKNLIYVYELIIISLGFTLLHILFQDVMGAIIDRYAYVTFPVVSLSSILLLITNKRFVNFVGKISPKLENKISNLKNKFKKQPKD